jgi:hypothetical protein
MEAFQGWAADPFGIHEARYFSQGVPTARVRDGDLVSIDEPPVGESGGRPAGPIPPPPPPGLMSPPPPAPMPPPPPSMPPPPPSMPPPPPPQGWTGGSVPPIPGDPASSAPGTHDPFSVPQTPGVWDTFAVSASTGAPQHARHSKRPFVAAIAAVAVVVAAVVSSVVLLGGKNNAEAEVIAAVNSSMADRTAHVNMTLSGGTSSSPVTGTGSGAIDFSQNAMELQMTVGASGQQVPIDVKFLAGVVYENIPGLDQIAPGKSWISIDFSALQQAAGQSPGSLGASNDPAAMLRVLAQHGNTVVPIGSSTVNGVDVQGFSVNVNVAAVRAQLDNAHLPSWMHQAISGVNFNGANLKVYVDNSGLLRRFAMHVVVSPRSGGSATVDETLDFSDYGAPVNVSAPPPDQVLGFEQFLQLAQQTGAGGL